MIGKKKIFTKKESKNIIKLYEDGNGSVFIANIYGVRGKAIIAHLRENNIIIRKQNIKLTDVQKIYILKEYNSGSPAQQISIELKINYTHIRKFLKGQGIVIKMAGEYSKIIDEEKVYSIINDYYLKTSYKDIAAKYNYSISFIKSTIKKNIIKNNFILCRECNIKKYINFHKDKNNKIYLICNNCRDKISEEKNKAEYKRRYERVKNSPEASMAKTISQNISNSLKKRKISKNVKTIFDVLNYDKLQLKNHLENLFEPWMNWDNWGKYNKKTWDENDCKTWKWQLDHIIPQSLFKYTSLEDIEFKKCWDLNNLRPLSAKQNYYDGVRRTRH